MQPRNEDKKEKKTGFNSSNDDLRVSTIGALLDFYSDRAVAHASFFVASVFGIVTVSAIIQQLHDILFVWLSVPIYSFFVYMGYYTLARFGYYADIAHVLSKHGLKMDQILERKKMKIEGKKLTIKKYIENRTAEQKERLLLIFLRNYLGRSKIILVAIY